MFLFICLLVYCMYVLVYLLIDKQIILFSIKNNINVYNNTHVLEAKVLFNQYAQITRRKKRFISALIHVFPRSRTGHSL